MSSSSSSLWRPPQWKNQTATKVIIIFPGTGGASQYSGNAPGSDITLPTGQTMYAFDSEMEIDHEQEIRPTEHPVQTGASISDHAFVIPARLTLVVGISEAMAPYFNPTTWVGAQAKSVSAYQTMLALQFARIPMVINTRLRTYTNMLIRSLSPTENSKTTTSLKMRVEFAQIFIANVTQTTSSARPQETNSTSLGAVGAQPPSASTDSQNNTEDLPMTYPTVIGAGNWSSVNTNNLGNLPAPN
jgi:hypothetical protein